MAILGGVLVALVVSSNNFARQNLAAEQRVLACELLDDFLEQNWETRNQLLIVGHGELPKEGWTWEVEQLSSSDTTLLQSQKVRVNAFAPNLFEPAGSVEILIPERAND